VPPTPSIPGAPGPPPAAALSAELTLDGFTSGTFGDAPRAVLRDVLAAELSLASHTVTIVAVADAVAARRRMLAPQGVTVALRLTLPGPAPEAVAAEIEARLAALPASAAFLRAVNDGLAAAGVAGRVAALHVSLSGAARPPPPAAPAAPPPQPRRSPVGGGVAGVIKLLVAAVAAELVFCAALVQLLKRLPDRIKQRCARAAHRMFPACACAWCKPPEKPRLMTPVTL
jgi:hypothetical protein